MDPLTQGVLGATLPQAAARGKVLAAATLVGALGGMAPDLDVLIRSSTDPLLFLEFHRQFSHSLLFIPVGGSLTGLLLYWLFDRYLQLGLRRSLLFTSLGYATHALLDACTTYGTQLLWPLSNQRFAWNNVSIIDPLFTLPLLALVIAGVLKQRPAFARAGLVWALCYLSLGLVQRDRAEAEGQALAASRGHVPVRLSAKPTFANLWLWKVIYENDQYFYVDAVRVLAEPRVYPGEVIPKLDVARDFPWLDKQSQQYRDLLRFAWFSDQFLAVDPQGRVIDARYSLIPNEFKPLWGIRLDPAAPDNGHVDYFTERDTGPAARQKFLALLTGAQAPASQSSAKP